MSKLLSSVSVVIVVRADCPSFEALTQMSAQLERMFSDIEFIVIANDVEPAASLALKLLIDQLPDSMAVFLSERVHEDVGRLVGVDHAVSDYVLFCTGSRAEMENVGRFLTPLRAGNDLVIGRNSSSVERSLFSGLLFTAFRTFFRWTTGKRFEDDPSSFRIMSRSAALHIATRADGEVLVRARNLGSGFPVSEVLMSDDACRRRGNGSFLRDLARGARLITTGSTMLLRASSYLAVIGGLGSAVYAFYAILIYAFRSDVQPGWTTLSLQLSGMMLLFSLQFLLLSEHVIQIAAHNPSSSRRHMIIRELRSPLSRRNARLNVVDQLGRFELGAPERFASVGGGSEER